MRNLARLCPRRLFGSVLALVCVAFISTSAQANGQYLQAGGWNPLCLTINVFDQPDSKKSKVKSAFKKAFDPREHAKALAGASAALIFGPGGADLAIAVKSLRTRNQVKAAWQGDLQNRTGVTLMECGSVDAKFQEFVFDGQFIRVAAKMNRCLKAKDGQAQKNGGRIQIGSCKRQQRAAWYRTNSGGLRNGKGLCIDVHVPQLNEEGAKIQLWQCNSTPQQTWVDAWPAS